MDEQQGKPGFRVNDRRRFAASGEEQPPAGDEGVAASEPPAGAPDAPDAPLEPVSFSTFVLGLSTQALLHLGEIDSPLSGKVEQDLPAAKHVIDILGILRDKSRNNLEQAEERLLDSVLYDLRMRYVALTQKSKKEGA
jgi:Domain of unknown function (DUF1844)